MEWTFVKKQEYDKKIILYALIPGLGQFKNGQKEKGAIFLTIFGLFCLESAFFGINALQELITLGSEPGIDNSMFLMVRGTLQLLITLIFVGFYVSQIRDAIKVNKNKTIGLPIATYSLTGEGGSSNRYWLYWYQRIACDPWFSLSIDVSGLYFDDLYDRVACLSYSLYGIH